MMQRIIDLKSPKGQEFLNEAKMDGRYFQQNLFSIFGKQKGPNNCGVQSSSLVMNAAHIGVNNMGTLVDGSLPYLEEKMFTFPETRRVKTQEDIVTCGGLTLQEVGDLLRAHGNSVQVYHAADTSADDFRSSLKETLGYRDSSCGIIVNYHMATLGQEPTYGHHSPLVAYLPEEDRALLLDTWWDTKECWAKVEALFVAMNTIDSASGLTRGYCVFKYVARP